jgi:Tfp pilus assembly protein PilZ
VALKFDKRRYKRLSCETVIWHDNLLPDIYYNAKMHNISKAGVYFESDQIIYPGEDIYIGLKKSTSPMQNSQDHIRVEIKWRKDLQDASFRFGYGAKFINPINTLVRSIDKAALRQKSTQGDAAIHNRDPRKHVRKPYRKVMFFGSKSKTYQGLITNISRGGAYIITRNKFYVGQFIQLVIPADKNRKEVKLKGWVVRLSPQGLGVRFDRRTGRDRRNRVDRRCKLKSTAKKSRRNEDKVNVRPDSSYFF